MTSFCYCTSFPSTFSTIYSAYHYCQIIRPLFSFQFVPSSADLRRTSSVSSPTYSCHSLHWLQEQTSSFSPLICLPSSLHFSPISLLFFLIFTPLCHFPTGNFSLSVAYIHLYSWKERVVHQSSDPTDPWSYFWIRFKLKQWTLTRITFVMKTVTASMLLMA